MKNLTKEACLALLGNNYIGRIAYISQGKADIIPITYFYDSAHQSIITYSGLGNKIAAMRKNNAVSFQVDEITSLDTWKSVLLYGEFEELQGLDAKHLLHVFTEGVKKVILKKDNLTPQFIGEFSSKMESEGVPIVCRINILEVKGKERD